MLFRSLIVINRNLYKKMPFDPVKDLAPVASIIRNQFVLAVHSSLPVKTLGEFVEFARSDLRGRVFRRWLAFPILLFGLILLVGAATWLACGIPKC